MNASPITTLLEHLHCNNATIPRGDSAITPYQQDTMFRGDPELVVRPSDEKEIQEILRACHAHKIPITPCAGRSAMTGAGIATSGVCLSSEKLSGIIDIGRWENHPIARVQPGTYLKAMHGALLAQGWFYPPSPTSRAECMLAGTVSTNATGDTTYKYGPTRRYIRALKIAHADGSMKEYVRPWDHHVTETKNRAGYCLDGPLIDHFIGAEGTLGVITEITIDLLSAPQPHFTLLVFFPDNFNALRAIVAANHDARVSPSSLEFLDGEALRVMATHPTFPPLPANAGAALLISQEYPEEMRDPFMLAWFDLLAAQASEMRTLLDHTIVASTPDAHAQLAAWRHHIPAHVNEIGHRLEKTGGGKVGSDWWVPLPQMLEMMRFCYDGSAALAMPFLAFAHLGNGHPHVNYLARTADEKTRAHNFVLTCCHEAVRRGGGVAGEHGLGKLKHTLLAIQHDASTIKKMRALKSAYDPHGILSPGNLWE